MNSANENYTERPLKEVIKNHLHFNNNKPRTVHYQACFLSFTHAVLTSFLRVLRNTMASSFRVKRPRVVAIITHLLFILSIKIGTFASFGLLQPIIPNQKKKKKKSSRFRISKDTNWYQNGTERGQNFAISRERPRVGNEARRMAEPAGSIGVVRRSANARSRRWMDGNDERGARR